MARQKNDGRGRIGGRAKGTPNKATATIREIITRQWQRYHDAGTFEKDIDALEPATRAIVMERYASYIAPKMKSIDIDLDTGAHITIEDHLRQLADQDQ